MNKRVGLEILFLTVSCLNLKNAIEILIFLALNVILTAKHLSVRLNKVKNRKLSI